MKALRNAITSLPTLVIQHQHYNKIVSKASLLPSQALLRSVHDSVADGTIHLAILQLGLLWEPKSLPILFGSS